MSLIFGTVSAGRQKMAARGIRRWHPRCGRATERLGLGVALNEGVHCLRDVPDGDNEPQPKGDEPYEVYLPVLLGCVPSVKLCLHGDDA